MRVQPPILVHNTMLGTDEGERLYSHEYQVSHCCSIPTAGLRSGAHVRNPLLDNCTDDTLLKLPTPPPPMSGSVDVGSSWSRFGAAGGLGGSGALSRLGG